MNTNMAMVDRVRTNGTSAIIEKDPEDSTNTLHHATVDSKGP